MIRDGLLESEAVLSLPVEARWLYVSILLSADDVGLFEATPFRLARRADVRREHADKLLAFLADSDLVRLYEVAGKRYGFIPKFGQRLQIKRIKHAVPPDALLQDEVETINRIKHLASKPTVDHGLATVDHGCTSDVQPSEVEVEVEVEVEASTPKKEEEKTPRKRSSKAASQPYVMSVADLVALGVDGQQAADWMIIRKGKKLPLTSSAWDGIKQEIDRAGMSLTDALKECNARGWAGFKAAWVQDSGPKKNGMARKHSGFDSKNYRDGVNEDGTFC
jgi:hypothetical protein